MRPRSRRAKSYRPPRARRRSARSRTTCRTPIQRITSRRTSHLASFSPSSRGPGTRSFATSRCPSARTLLRYLRREDLIDGDPGAMVATPKQDIRMPAHLSEGEMSALLDAASGETPLGRRDRAILELFYASGLRLSELAGLGLDDLN